MHFAFAFRADIDTWHVLETKFAHRFCEFIMDLEYVGEVDEIDAAEETQLTEEQIQNIAAEFGQHATTAQELFKMKRQMWHDDFRGWVNAVGYLQMLQNAFAHGIVEKSGSLWKQAIVQRYM